MKKLVLRSLLFYTNLFKSYVYLRMSSSSYLRKKQNVGPKILMTITTISFFGWLSRNQFKPVWAETVKNYPARKLEFLSPQNRYMGHQGSIWKIMGKAIFSKHWLSGPILSISWNSVCKFVGLSVTLSHSVKRSFCSHLPTCPM